MTPAALGALLSRACANGSTLEYVLARTTGRVPVIVEWRDDFRTTLCGPWRPFTYNASIWSEYAEWIVFDYEIYECDGTAFILHIKRYERGVKNGESEA